MIFSLNNTLVNGEVIILNLGQKPVFKGTVTELIELVCDTKSMAESIQMDLDADNIEDVPEVAYKQYVEFAKKYNK